MKNVKVKMSMPLELILGIKYYRCSVERRMELAGMVLAGNPIPEVKELYDKYVNLINFINSKNCNCKDLKLYLNQPSVVGERG